MLCFAGTHTQLRRIALWPAAALCILALILSTGVLVEQAAASTAGPADAMLTQGFLSAKYVLRKTRLGGEAIRDEDLFSSLRIDLSKPNADGYEFHFFGSLRDDLSNNRDRMTYSPFEDIGDSYRHSAVGYLYEAHLDINKPFSSVTQLRFGRQDGSRGEPVFFDGLAMDISLGRSVAATLYGGAAVHLYELDNRWGDDTLGGLGVDFFPASGTLLSTDYLYVTDKRQIFDTKVLHDQLLSVKLSHRFSPNLRSTAKVRYVNGKSRDGSLRIVLSAPGAAMDLNASYTRQFRTQGELSNELSPYYDVIGLSYPYESFDVRARKLFGKYVAIDVGYFQRSLIHREQESSLNRAYHRTYGVLDVHDVLLDGLSLSFTGEQWKSGTQKVDSTGYDAGYAFGRTGRRKTRINAGSYYSLYKYDYYLSLGERTKVRTYYGKFEYPFTEQYVLTVAYEYERGIEDYETAKVGMRYDF